MVRHALTEMVDWPSRLIAFSDDMDGMRKVPPGVPHQDMMHEHLDQPLCRCRIPYGCGHKSYADHNNGICSASSSTGSASTTSSSPHPTATLGPVRRGAEAVLRRYDAIIGVMLPTLREERRKTYSPVLPISPASGKVLQVPVEVLDPETGWSPSTTRARGRAVYPFGRRQAAVEGRLGDALGRARRRLRNVGQGSDRFGDPELEDRPRARRPATRGVQLRAVPRREWREDLEDQGNGVTIDEWLSYAPEESLVFYLYREPRRPSS
jgi:lysyl-tRNA synthetase class 1